jgi:hypothetical protein
MKSPVVLLLLTLSVLVGCSQRGSHAEKPEESLQAKQLLQGVWSDESSESVVFQMKGDSVYYPDSTSMPAYFRVYGDTLYIGKSSRYHIEKQTEHVLWFMGQDGEVVKLKKGDEAESEELIVKSQPQILTLNEVMKRDTVVMFNGNRYHLYIAVNPTRYKVVRHTLNDDGLDVENVYYDNIIHLSIFQGSRQLFSSDFRRKQYNSLVAERFLEQAILNNMEYSYADEKGFHLNVSLCQPGDASCYLVEHVVSYDGKLTTKLQEY